MNEMHARRNFLKAATALAAASGIGLNVHHTAQAANHGARLPQVPHGKTVTRIAFGSCAKESKEQPIWNSIIATRPDLFLFLGDNIYGDTRDMNVLREKYARFGAIPGVKELRETVPHLAIWDDHDYGENDAGMEYPMKEESRGIFCDFWGEPADSPRRTQDGIYASYFFGARGRRVQIIMPDLRFNRTPILKLDLGGKAYDVWAKELEQAGKPVPGPYSRNPDPKATMLGERQWRWLEAQLKIPADVRIIASGLQVLADFPGWEGWTNYARDHQRLIELIRNTRANGVIFLSGDTHYAELSRLDVNVPYPLYDLTSSGLTEVWPVLPPNDLRVGEALREANFGVIEIDWGVAPQLRLEIRDGNGLTRMAHRIRLGELRV